ncbi:MAG: TetR/AcrR family transcriptional regulator [Lachnospiraceae bacterium]|nr:TetR/AcrR family transcriptional regulator [Lachnospiraceae bacterium]
MKLTEKRKKSLTAKRTIKIFMESLCGLMMEKPFDKVTVSDICETSMIPRATFYNYFEDKYDLLNTYCEEFVKRPSRVVLAEEPSDFSCRSLQKILMVVDEEHEFLQRIAQLNEHGVVFQQMKEAMEQEVLNLYNEGSIPPAPIPQELDAKIIAASVIAVCQWWLSNYEDYTAQDILVFFSNKLTTLKQC